MKKQNLVILTVMVAGILFIIMFYSLYNSQQSASYPEPDWVREIKNKIDLEKCGPTNCEACNTDKCAEFELCKITSARYACGPACDAAISFCISS